MDEKGKKSRVNAPQVTFSVNALLVTLFRVKAPQVTLFRVNVPQVTYSE